MDELEIGRKVYAEILCRFPEAKPFLDQRDEDLPYIALGNLAKWLETVPNCSSDIDIVRRLDEFIDWAASQVEGTTGADDIFTILTVGFLEELFESSKLIYLLPHLFLKKDLIESKDYWIQWVGEENYSRALSLFDPTNLTEK